MKNEESFFTAPFLTIHLLRVPTTGVPPSVVKALKPFLTSALKRYKRFVQKKRIRKCSDILSANELKKI